MSIHPVTVRPGETTAPDDLALLLRAAAAGDARAFTRFTDATAGVAFRLELARAEARRRLSPRPPVPADVLQQAELATRARYLEAWRRCGEHAGSGLSPRAWLLSLRTGDGARR